MRAPSSASKGECLVLRAVVRAHGPRVCTHFPDRRRNPQQLPGTPFAELQIPDKWVLLHYPMQVADLSLSKACIGRAKFIIMVTRM